MTTQQVIQEQLLTVKDRISVAIPLLPRPFLGSQQPYSIVKFIQKQFMDFDTTQEQDLAPVSNIEKDIALPHQSFTDYLKHPEKICYNIMGPQQYSVEENSFGFQFFNKESQIFECASIENIGHNQSVLSFESRFESGNLMLAYQYTDTHYILFVRPDYNTVSYCQWFYFKVTNRTSNSLNITFSIVNMTKSYSLYCEGMRLLSCRAGKSNWVRQGKNILYKKNTYKRGNGYDYYTLSWESQINSFEQVYYAYSQPFSYSSLNKYLDEIEKSKYVKRQILCRTILNNRIDLLSISQTTYYQHKKVIVIMSRTHPAETVGSFVMNGLIDYLISDAQDARLLREKFVFKLIPMVNPDGVIHGNSRCSMKGVDLNRCWNKFSKRDHEVYAIKKLIMNTSKSGRLLMFCDLHGHSKKKNIFIYGCHDYSQPYASRELPYIISKIFEPFSFKDCNFATQKVKNGTARVSLWNKLRIPYIFTIESSLCGSEHTSKHLEQKGYNLMGENLCKAINIYFAYQYSPQSKYTKIKNNYNSRSKTKKEKSSNDHYESVAQNHQKQQNLFLKNIRQQLRTNEHLIQYGMQECQESESQEQIFQIYKQVKRQKKQDSASKFKVLKTEESRIQIALRQSRTERINLKSERGQNKLTYRMVNRKPDLLQNQSISNKTIRQMRISSNMKTQQGALNKKSILSRNNRLNQQKQSKYLEIRQQNNLTFSNNMRALKISYKQQKSLENRIIKSQRKIFKFAPHFVNFNFEEKFNLKNKSKILQSCRSKQFLSKIGSKDALLKFANMKFKREQLKRLDSKTEAFRRRNMQSHLESVLKKLNPQK